MENLTLKKIRSLLDERKISAVELLDFYLKNIKEKNEELNVFLEVFEKDALEQAKLADQILEKGESAPLLGIPIAIKDNILINGKTVSAASKILQDYKAVYNATVVDKLTEQGAVFVGRTNMDEFAMGGSTENSAFGVTKNPHDTTRVSGGSSGGSAAAVAAEMAPVSLGTDTGGSVRQPSSFCGVVGLKPTYGRVSRYGIIALGSSLDQVGPIAKTVEDIEILYDVIKGKDANDQTTIDNKELDDTVKTIGVPKGILDSGVSEEVRNNFNKTISFLSNEGFNVVEVELLHLKFALNAYYIIMPAEASANLARFDGMRYSVRAGNGEYKEIMSETRKLFGEEVKRRILIGTFVLSSGYVDAYYYKAVALRNKIKEEFNSAFEEVDVILTPTAPETAFKIGEKSDPITMYAADLFTVPANITGSPALSVPSGVSDSGLPFGVQIIAPHYGERKLFSLGKNIEKLR